MHKILKAALIFFLALNLSTGVNAGRKKESFQNNYQTKQQQVHYTRMTKNQIPMSFCPSPSCGMVITAPIAILLALSVMGGYFEATIPAHQKALPYPFRVLGSDEVVLSDHCHNPVRYPSEVKLANEALLGFIHPGLFSRPQKRYSEETLVQACKDRNLLGPEVDGQIKCFPDQAMMQTLEFDQSYTESGLQDRLYSDAAWEYLQEEFFPKESGEAASLPIEQFFGAGPEAFQNNIKKLNAVFQYGLSSGGEPGFEEFRPEIAALYIRHNDKAPSTTNMKDWKKHIQKNSPHLLDSYYAIEEIAHKLPKFLKTQPVFAHFADKTASLPFNDRLSWALQYIGYTRTFENYLVLTENFSYSPGYSAKEFDKLFNDLREETLKLFEIDPKKAAAYLHFRYVSIHPHADGNGRTARAIMNLILMSAGIEPVVFPSNQQYTEACVASSRENSTTPFEKFLRSVIDAQQQEKGLFIELSKKLNSCTHDCQAFLDSHFNK